MCFYGLNDGTLFIFVQTTVKCIVTLWKLGVEGKEKQEITHPLVFFRKEIDFNMVSLWFRPAVFLTTFHPSCIVVAVSYIFFHFLDRRTRMC